MGRLARGGRIQRERPLRFRFNGRGYQGFAGDTLASALMANDVSVVARSFKYHRARGIVGAGEEEPNAIVQLGEGAHVEPNVKATRVELYDGLAAQSVNCWPTVDFDIGALADRLHRFLPAGFYYKTFMGPPGWMFYERFIRRAAGLGRAPREADPDEYLKRHAHCDLLVIGAGPSGLAAARAAAFSGARVIVADDQAEFGGSLLWEAGEINGAPAIDWVASVTADLTDRRDVVMLSRTTVVGYYDHNHLVAVERLTDHLPLGARAGKPRHRLWHIRARRVILATGALERPLVFPDNDRPGTLLASAVRHYVNRFAATPGQRAVVFTNNDSAYAAALDLLSARIDVAGVIDVRRDGAGAIAARLRARGTPIHTGAAIVAVRGKRRVRAVQVAQANGPSLWIDCDTICMSGGWSPTVHLFSQSGGRLEYDDALASFVPAQSVQNEMSVGAAAGAFATSECLRQGHAAGLDAALASSCRPIGTARPPTTQELPTVQPVQAYWQTAATASARQWVDFQSDVTAKDVELAARESFVSVEHLKRYTTIGMATDQGKTSNVNALAILGQVTGRTPDAVGTTRFRPPYVPLAMSAIAGGAVGDLWLPRRHLPAEACHRELGAVFHDFSGWQRPNHYPRSGETLEQAARREHLAVRRRVGLFDGSPIGKIEVTGRDADAFLQRIYANNIANLAAGRIRYGLMLNENGVIIDDGVCVRLADDSFLLSPSSSAAPRIAAWLEEWRQCEFPDLDVHVADVTTSWAALAIAGPQARAVLERLGIGVDLSPGAFPHMTLRGGRIASVPAKLFRVSFSGELQYEIHVPASYGDALWRQVMLAGAPERITAVGLEAWLRLRLEKGYVHVGTDTDGTTIPDDIGFGAAIARKAEDFVGRRSLMRPAMMRRDREQLVGLRSPAPATVLPVGGCIIEGPSFTPPMEKQGRVTSSCFSPILGGPVALAMLRRGRERLGERVTIYANGGLWQAEVCSPLFYDPEGERLNA